MDLLVLRLVERSCSNPASLALSSSNDKTYAVFKFQDRSLQEKSTAHLLDKDFRMKMRYKLVQQMTKKQLELNIYQGTHGGRRPKSGRKRIHSRGVSHSKRETVTKRTPLHINFKFKCQIRNKMCLKILKGAIQNARKHGLHVIHFSLQSNHIHLVAEAQDNKILTKGMRALTISFTKGLKKGRIQLERYHLHVLKTLQETKNAIEYVLFNEQKHSKLKKSRIDSYSSLLYLPKASNLIRQFARKKKMQLIVEKRDDDEWETLPAKSFLLTRGLQELY